MSLFFFNDTATTEIYTLSLHDALPISEPGLIRSGSMDDGQAHAQPGYALLVSEHLRTRTNLPRRQVRTRDAFRRSEEHTSELQSQSNLVCRLLLEKKKKKKTQTIQHST